MEGLGISNVGGLRCIDEGNVNSFYAVITPISCAIPWIFLSDIFELTAKVKL
jgi:hypothetical protein